jgi:hypothetical protein
MDNVDNVGDDAVAAVAGAVGKFDWRMLELELRAGRRTPGGFDPDVGAAGHDFAKSRLDAWSRDDRVKCLGCESTVDRLVGELRETTGSAAGRLVIRKKRLRDVDIPGGRLSLSLEAATHDAVPHGGATRRKCRWSYSVGPWRVDLTRVVPSADPDCDEAKYEVEVELADRDELFRTPLPELLADGARVLRSVSERDASDATVTTSCRGFAG